MATRRRALSRSAYGNFVESASLGPELVSTLNLKWALVGGECCECTGRMTARRQFRMASGRQTGLPRWADRVRGGDHVPLSASPVRAASVLSCGVTLIPGGRLPFRQDAPVSCVAPRVRRKGLCEMLPVYIDERSGSESFSVTRVRKDRKRRPRRWGSSPDLKGRDIHPGHTLDDTVNG